MLEPEMAFCDLNQDIKVAQDYLKYVIEYTLNNCAEDLEFFDKFIEKDLLSKLQSIVETPFQTITYTEAVNILEKSSKKFEYSVSWGKDLQSEHERYLTEEYFKTPLAVIDYPASIKAFYMRENDDGKTVSAMDILVPKIGEIIGGAQREERLDVLLTKINKLGLNPNDYWWYLELRKYGTVPHSGFGLGFERLVQFVTGIENIRDVIPFPRATGQASF
jgi:asparaginyl-tRNA synthetase